MPKVLAILAEGFEEIEAITPIDLLRRAGAEVTVAARIEPLAVAGRNGIIVQTETTLAQVADDAFDLVFLPGGPGTIHLRADPKVRAVVQRQHAAGKWIAAICAAPTVLHDAGLLEGCRYTAHFSVENELPRVLRDQRVVADGHIVTSRGAGTALEFGLHLIATLFSSEKSREIAASVCF